MQEVVEEALKQLGWQGRRIQAAGRTDTGVHASGQVIAFDLEWKHSTEKLRQALNAHLPADVAARVLRPALPGFNPRRDAVARTYRYSLFIAESRDPLRERYAWRVWPAVDFDQARKAAHLLTGQHDFAAFGSPPKVGSSTVRMVRQASWELKDMTALFEVTANAFLYHMVRHMVAAQVAVGQGALSLEQIQNWLDHPKASNTQVLAPPQGLVLTEVQYPLSKLSEEYLENEATNRK